MLVLTGARLFDGERFLDDRSVVIDGARIAAVLPDAERPRVAETRDLGGGLLSPGFIDVQVNGGGGALFNQDPSVDCLLTISAAHRRHGVTGLMPTLVTDAPELTPRAITAVREARKIDPAILGVHLEGPFLDVRRKGAHAPRFIRSITRDDVDQIANADCGAVMTTLAPNRVSPDIVRELAARGALVSLGHSDATYEEARLALDSGARAFTHLHNAMSPTTGREPGMVGAALSDRASFVGVIADGLHVHPVNLILAFRAKRRDRFMLISDAMSPAAGGPDGFHLQGRWIPVKDGALRLEDGTLAGSMLTMDAAVRYCVETLALPLEDALTMAARGPAAFLRRDHELGRIAPGYLASLVWLDETLRVGETWVEGQQGHARPS